MAISGCQGSSGAADNAFKTEELSIPQLGTTGVSSREASRKDVLQVLFDQVDIRWLGEPSDGELACVVCGRTGHACCGMRYWTALRAAWLRVSEEEVAKEPVSFEDPGALQSRGNTAVIVRDLSEGELEDLEDCLDAVQRPFPKLKRSVPLAQAVQCAEALWDNDT
eukprot:CAMPEP_0194505198 /NCGR_PEP_ID=MMETSP0253-20130528/31221_1 /TAXON_ID=2966 /ORGANISM="Noctiluca scintillans" /LENGTH=165 /DNA_ID=CAMNT_0039347705 /DNA_START=17 /DNA_END=514 /DNA_ORIENTATION=+